MNRNNKSGAAQDRYKIRDTFPGTEFTKTDKQQLADQISILLNIQKSEKKPDSSS